MPRTASQTSLLLYAPVPLYLFEGSLYIEGQAVNGLQLWARYFDWVTVMMPVSAGAPPAGWAPLHSYQQELSRIRIEPLPMASHPGQFLRVLPRALHRIGRLIAEADYLSFAIGGGVGDWGAVSCLVAHHRQRPYAVWTDRVDSKVMPQSQKPPRDKAPEQPPWRSRLQGRLYHRPMAWLEKAAIQRADLGLFHGAETFRAYQGLCRNSHLVQDIHVAEADHISDSALVRKAAGVAGKRPLRLIYTGQAEAMSGPTDWITVLERLNGLVVDFNATWIGDGAALPQMQARIQRAGLTECVDFPGFVEDHGAVLQAVLQADIFMFCHKTAETPRCLIEALTCGTPVLGYDCTSARELISGQGGDGLVPCGDTAALAQRIAELDADRDRLARRMINARADGMPFCAALAFAQRAEILRQHLPVGRPLPPHRRRPTLGQGWDAARN